MDADTIILSKDIFNQLKEYELIMFGNKKYKTQNIGFIYASLNSSIINDWLKAIIKNVDIYKQIMIKSKTNNYYKNNLNKLRVWNYLGNGIVDNIIKNSTRKKFLRLDICKIHPFPEIQIFKNLTLNNKEKYRKLYFQKENPHFIMKYSKSVIMLHNSWTPFKYRIMSENDFLKQDITLSKLLNHIIYKKV